MEEERRLTRFLDSLRDLPMVAELWLLDRVAGPYPEIEGSAKRRFFAVLHTERINSPLEAVRAAIVQEHHQNRIGS
jgi:hypothetical protein